ncbi:hypothetical protein CEY00_Acc02207 [Actinidia chinensis var. chinensis]|uniref:Uncharacterized protein n=1 Tax=Actinidia chinensis var. chinensis TaxID=1590841 RepID=A0A2R6RYA4_ACTCC|nr:hypothetical protein CEY00_Acc02207 [Actinidia chinensis var. chinensis]
MQMDIRCQTLSLLTTSQIFRSSSSNRSPLKPNCSRRDLPKQPPQSGDDDKKKKKKKKNSGDKSPTDWYKAWSSFKKQGKKSIFSQFSPNKYVSWNPRRSQYPLSEEVDPIKRTERSNLMLWPGL